MDLSGINRSDKDHKLRLAPEKSDWRKDATMRNFKNFAVIAALAFATAGVANAQQANFPLIDWTSVRALADNQTATAANTDETNQAIRNEEQVPDLSFVPIFYAPIAVYTAPEESQDEQAADKGRELVVPQDEKPIDTSFVPALYLPVIVG